MRTIWKFEFSVADSATLRMPICSTILRVGSQRPHMIAVWAMVDDQEKTEEVNLRVRGTGHPIDFDVPGPFKYIGSVDDGPFVWHVFLDAWWNTGV